MKIMKTILSTAILALTGISALQALDIPLSGATEGGGGGLKIGYVDMDKIFQIYPQTQAAKEDYAKQLKKKRELLASKEAELRDVEGKISVLQSTLKEGGSAATPPADGTSVDTAEPAAAVGQNIVKMRDDLDARKAELVELRKQATADLAAFQAQQSQLILGKIYQALRDVAVEEQVAVVVDKSSILYGDASIDLTDKLQQRVRGF
jgi:Skp family chaperone for outer membrane proteins